MKIAIFAITLLAISCGRSSTKNKEEEQLTPICGGDKSILCLPQIKWDVETTAVNFPENLKISVNNMEVGNTCTYKESFRINRNDEGRMVVTFIHSFFPNKFFNLEIVDLGRDCTNNAVFESRHQPAYSASTMTVEGRKFRSVYVTLD